MNQSKKIVFFGSGPVAKASLEALFTAGFKIEAVITKPSPAHHKGSVPVLEFAGLYHLPVFTPANKQELSNLYHQTKFQSLVGVVVDYGLIINQDVIDAFPMGIVNSHFSLLPQWRGADPITFSVLSGQKTTGVSLMLINAALDEGLLLSQESIDLPPAITTPHLTNQLVALSNKMLVRDLPRYLNNQITPYPQPNQPPTYSRKLTKEDGIIDWSKPAIQLEREVRAFQGWPKSKTNLFNRSVIVLAARVAQNVQDGTLVHPCGDNTFLEITQLVAPSGKTMAASDFLRGIPK